MMALHFASHKSLREMRLISLITYNDRFGPVRRSCYKLSNCMRITVILLETQSKLRVVLLCAYRVLRTVLLIELLIKLVFNILVQCENILTELCWSKTVFFGLRTFVYFPSVIN